MSSPESTGYMSPTAGHAPELSGPVRKPSRPLAGLVKKISYAVHVPVSPVSPAGSNALRSNQSTGNLVRKFSPGLLARKFTDPTTINLPATNFSHTFATRNLPEIQLREYGVEWSKDNVVMLTNSVRREIIDLYAIVQSLEERTKTLRPGDIASFFVWFEIFGDFFSFIMKLIEEKLIPWVERSTPLPEDEALESEGGRMKVGKDLIKTVSKIRAHRAAFEDMNPGSAFLKLLRVLKKWIPSLIAYLDALDRDVSQIVDESYTPAECEDIHKLVAKEAHGSSKKSVNITLLTRFLEDRPGTLEEWRKAYLEPADRSAHPRYWKATERDHFEVVSYFRRCTPSLNQAANQE